MELTRAQFDILGFLESAKGGTTQRGIAKATGLSVGTVNQTLARLTGAGLTVRGRIGPAGIAALEPYRVRRAVFFAAGFGARLVPVTLNTPKSLIRVKGVRIIDTLLDAVIAAGIEEIFIVRGHFGEQFDELLRKYPGIRFLENPLYNESNNISSAMRVRHRLRNAYVMEADLLLRNPRLITRYQYSSNYLGVPVELTDDWCFETKNGIITKLRIGGRKCHHMFGVSYWNREDGAKLADHIRQVYEMPGGRERYWDQAPLEYFKGDYAVAVRECTFDDIAEIDTISELKRLDESY
ncbi:MAG: MarR family transcriptional regulator [Treponema sp.]|jgi:CTP:phosphocholine cytidylyltransferase-like protein|nr:MarR family transcriptional regulator [Treponema sp.]